MRVGIVLAGLLVCTSASAEHQNRMWNSGYSVWQRGTTFTNGGNGMATADKTRNGPGTGGAEVITKEVLSPEVRAHLVADPLMAASPRFGKKLTWTVAPTSGEGRIADYVKYFSMEEVWDDDVNITAGQTITVKVCAWSNSDQPFYIYASQFMGWHGDTGKHGTGNTIIGSGAGRDYNTFKAEIFNRSAQKMMTTKPQCFAHTFESMDDLSLAKPAQNNGLVIGIGTDFDTLAVGREVYITALEYDFGPAQKWKPIADELANALAQYRLQIWGRGVSGFALSSTSVLVSLPYKGPFKSPGPTAMKLLNQAPRFQVGATAQTAKDAKITQWQADQFGAYAVIDGFEGLTPGQPAIYGRDERLVLIEYWH